MSKQQTNDKDLDFLKSEANICPSCKHGKHKQNGCSYCPCKETNKENLREAK
jgi:hypothetical protein